MDTIISCQHLWKVFGPNPQQVLATRQSSKQDILKRTGHVVAVKDVSFTVQHGETFVIMGLSGSGKSTLVRCLQRLVEPTSGQIYLDGEDVRAMSNRQLRDLRRHRMSMVFQNFGLFPHRRVIDNVAYGLEVQGVPKNKRHKQAEAMLERVGLVDWAYHYPANLSGGMQQRVGLARALATDPQILLLDEPFGALDPLTRRELQDEFLKLQRAMHKTAVFITHDFAEANKLAHHVALMKDGEIIQLGTPADLMLHPVNTYVQEFTKGTPRTEVLTAAALMQPVTAQVALASQSVKPHTRLGDLLPLAMRSELPLPVIDTQHNIVGLVARDSVLQALG